MYTYFIIYTILTPNFNLLESILHKNNFLFRKIRQIIDTFGCHLNVELQQRGVEFSQLFKKYEHLRPALLERMPPMEVTRNTNDNGPILTNGEVEEEDLSNSGLDDQSPIQLQDSVCLYKKNEVKQ